MSLNTDEMLGFMANSGKNKWNRKLCFEAQDALVECTQAQDNKNKYRCPDQLYAYEMWCPPDFRAVHQNRRLHEDQFEKDFPPHLLQYKQKEY